MQKTSEVYKKLYHYTTWEGLKGILQTQSLWATHYKFLNDYSELTLIKKELVPLLYPIVLEGYKQLIKHKPSEKGKIQKQGGLEHCAQHDVEAFVEAEYRTLGDEIYILSFCGEPEKCNIADNGLLSQWRGYGAGGGATLVFDTEKLEGILNKEYMNYEYSPILLADVIYSDDEQKLKDELTDDLNILADIVRQFFNHEKIGKEKEIDASKGYMPFVRCISRYKHFGFSEENEVRVVVLPTLIDDKFIKLAKEYGENLKPQKERKSRSKNCESIPYIELFDSVDIKLPIEKIIIGPHKDKEARAVELRGKLSKTNIEIVCSEIPFVDR